MTVTKTIALPSGRTLVGYDLCSGRAISDGSTAQMMNFVEDAKKDIAYLASLSSRSAEAGKPEVKALEWARNGNRHDAGSIVGRYTIEGRNPGYGLLVPAPVAVRLFIDLEAAKAAAQSDYESRILSALAAPVADIEPVSVPEGWQLVPNKPTMEMVKNAAGDHEGENWLPFSLWASMLAAAPQPNPSRVDAEAWEKLCKLTFAVQHNPNCASQWLVRLPGKGPIDMKPYGDPLGLVRHQTGDILGFGKTLSDAARAALAAQGEKQP